jgi:hypothetical protein
VRLLLAIGALGTALGAPLQCGGEPDYAERRYEQPGEALYALAGRFKQQGNDEAWQKTLEYIVERYPNSREAVMARDDLERSAE